MNTFYMMVGLPGSGKTTVSKKLSKEYNAIVISTDDLREELLGDVQDQSSNGLIFQEAIHRIIENLKDKNVIFDATNINYKKRMSILQQLKNVRKIAVLVLAPIDECLERNNNRDRKVSTDVLDRMAQNFYVPQLYEGFNDIKIINNYNRPGFIMHGTFDYKDFLYFLSNISQDNHNHTLTIGEHCAKVCSDDSLSPLVSMAGLLHDFGKFYTKSYDTNDGENTKIAHYYGHENVSAYLTMIFLAPTVPKPRLLEIAALVQWHMLLHNQLSEKSIKKYIKLFGEQMWENLKQLHKADMNAR